MGCADLLGGLAHPISVLELTKNEVDGGSCDVTCLELQVHLCQASCIKLRRCGDGGVELIHLSQQSSHLDGFKGYVLCYWENGWLRCGRRRCRCSRLCVCRCSAGLGVVWHVRRPPGQGIPASDWSCRNVPRIRARDVGGPTGERIHVACDWPAQRWRFRVVDDELCHLRNVFNVRRLSIYSAARTVVSAYIEYKSRVQPRETVCVCV